MELDEGELDARMVRTAAAESKRLSSLTSSLNGSILSECFPPELVRVVAEYLVLSTIRFADNTPFTGWELSGDEIECCRFSGGGWDGVRSALPLSACVTPFCIEVLSVDRAIFAVGVRHRPPAGTEAKKVSHSGEWIDPEMGYFGLMSVGKYVLATRPPPPPPLLSSLNVRCHVTCERLLMEHCMW